MKTVEVIGYKRANLGKSDSKKLRAEGNVPCVIYGGDEQIHFYAPMILFRELVYTDEAHFVHLNIEGDEYQAILQDIQFHPVSEVILHVDFLQIFEGKTIKMDIPVHFEGESPGVAKGGTLIKKRRHLRIQSLPKHMPEHITVDLSGLDFGKAIKVQEIAEDNFEILDTKIASVAVVEIPRALRGKQTAEAEETEAEETE
ncbi:50S ribosomal protein L25/general stress protein Ctc [Fulvivirga maritima]|uniref:50S ribosomal protein L25/general stress protein Ctc n=1 Tax=Fulvivirga maritima TaxID=2904247 RepID=UPI001F3D5F87|nr:50S ribosomal protein L25/general stress protein Ctc [Fulvivirga maritima]UII29412.1 50S ribosomal protein L25/general stress protein Ctc [Fulvivirga maritima]